MATPRPDPNPATSSPGRPAAEPAWLRRAALYGALAVVGLAVGSWALARLYELLLLLVAALFIAFALEPLVDRLERRHWRRGVATGAVFALCLCVLLGFVAVVGFLLADQLRHLGDAIPTQLHHGQRWLRRHDVSLDVSRLGERIRTDLASGAWAAGLGALSVLAKLATIMFFAFYLVVDGPRLRRALCSLLPPTRQAQLLGVWETAIEKTGAYLLSRSVLAVISSIVHAVAFTLCGVPYGAVMGVWQGVMSQALPIVGTYIGAALPLLVTLNVSLPRALVVLGVIVVYQQLENYLLVPRIQGRAMDLHPAVALGSVLVGGALLGFTGVLLAMPMAATIQGFVSAYVHRYELVEHDLVAGGLESGERDDPEGHGPAPGSPGA